MDASTTKHRMPMGSRHLSAAEWKKFAKDRGQPDDALLKALVALEKAEGGEREPDALDALAEQAAVSRKAARGEKPMLAYLDRLDDALQAQRERIDLQESVPDLLTTRMVPLLRQLQGGVGMHLLLARAGQEVAVLLSRRPIPKSRQKLLADYLAESGKPRFFPGNCVFEENAYTFVLPSPAAGMARKLKAALVRQVGRKLAVRVRGDDGTEEARESDDADDRDRDRDSDHDHDRGDSDGDAAGPPPPALPGTAPPSAGQAFNARLAALIPRIKAALAVGGEPAASLRSKVGEAGADAARQAFGPAHQHLDAVEAMLSASDDRIARFKGAFKRASRAKVAGPGASTRRDAALLHSAREEGGIESLADEALRDRARRLLAHQDRLWQAVTEAWRQHGREPVPARRSAEIAALLQTGDGVLAQRADLAEMRRLDKTLALLLSLPDSDDDYLADFIRNDRNWFQLKARFENGELPRARMQALWNYRQKITDGMLAELQAEYRFEQAAVGSTDLTSDIDVGVVSHGETADGAVFHDWQIVAEFNRRFRARFQQEPGVFFDVNLYASAPRVRTASDLPDDDPAKRSMQAMSVAGQDVGALIKQRRYMSYQEFEAYQEAVLQEMAAAGDGPGARQALDTTARQFSEADALYQISLRRSLDEALRLLGARLAENPGDERSRTSLARLQGVSDAIASQRDLAAGQKLLIDAVESIEHDLELSMAVNNQIYVGAIKEVRALEEKIFRLRDRHGDAQQQVEALQARSQRSPQEDALLAENLEILARMGAENAEAGLTARVGQLHATAVLFANEAYLSEGPMKHIVDAAQGARFHLEAGLVDDVSPFDWDTMSEAQKAQRLQALQAERRAALTTHECLQSFNEQFGDLLKDLRHYSDAAPGYAFYRSAKYLARLLDALVLLQGKLTAVDWPAVTAGGGLRQTPAALAQAVGAQILPVRGGKGDALLADAAAYAPVDGEAPEAATARQQRREAALQAHVLRQMSALFGVDDVEELKSLAQQLGQRVNAACRALIAGEQRAADESPFFKSVRRHDKDSSGGRAS